MANRKFNPYDIKDLVFDYRMIQELEEKGIFDAVADTVRDNHTLNDNALMRLLSEKHGVTNMNSAGLNFIKSSITTPYHKTETEIKSESDKQMDDILNDINKKGGK